MLLECCLSAAEAGSADAEVPAGPANVLCLVGMHEDPKPALNLVIFWLIADILPVQQAYKTECLARS